MWNIEQDCLEREFNAHEGSKHGLSAIVELKDPSYLIRAEYTDPDPNLRYLVTACFDKSEFKIWKMDCSKGAPELTQHL